MSKITLLTYFLIGIFISSTANAQVASWYGPGFHKKRTASGAIYNMYALTAAHKSLPFGTKVEVTNLSNKKSVVVKINDRGPFTPGRVIDLSKKANQIIECDLCKVKITVLEKGDGVYRKQ